MAYIAFIAVLFGAAGTVGGIETGNIAGTIAAAAFHAGGIIAMAMAGRKERGQPEDGEDGGAGPCSRMVDKPVPEGTGWKG